MYYSAAVIPNCFWSHLIEFQNTNSLQESACFLHTSCGFSNILIWTITTCSSIITVSVIESCFNPIYERQIFDICPIFSPFNVGLVYSLLISFVSLILRIIFFIWEKMYGITETGLVYRNRTSLSARSWKVGSNRK